jgi:hypothetical protein
MRTEMRKSDKQSDKDLRGPLVKGLPASSIFSEHRVVSPEEPSNDDALERMPRFQRLRAIRARGFVSNAPQEVDNDSDSVEADVLPPPPPRHKTFLLELPVVEQIQAKQLEIFRSPEVYQKLGEIRMAADMEQIRFMHRIKPFKVEVQRELLKEYNFPDTEGGLAAMERAVAAHMADSNEVAMRAKDLMILIMGDIW